ncbi:MAG: chemotaxis protein, partial [Betaproteobacteria bacterium]|nr:chemotaxis protein [Betaproteobacteria bacterium]
MKRTPQRSLLLLGLFALIWGAALVVAAGLDAEPALLLTVWGAGAALLVLLAFYLGLSIRLDLLQVQQALREAVAAPDAQAPLKSSLAAFWQPLIDAASAARQPVEDAAREKAKIAAQTAAQLAALQSALEAERAQSSAWQRQAAQAQDAARAVTAAKAEATAAALPDPREAMESVARVQREQQQAAWVELSSLASSLAAELEAQIGAAAQREATAQTHAAARAEKLAQAEAGHKRSAEQL